MTSHRPYLSAARWPLAAALGILLSLVGTGDALADTGKLNLHVDLGFGMPSASYLAPPGSNDNTGYIGGGLFLTADYVIAGPFAIEVLVGAGYMADIFSGDPPPSGGLSSDFQSGAIIPWTATVGGRLRLLRNDAGSNLWLSAHVGVCGLDGIQFCGDGGLGYEWQISNRIGIGPFARYQIMAGGNSTPWQATNDTHYTAAVWAGVSLSFNAVPRDTEEEAAQDLDQDDDGILDANDACPTDPEDMDGHNDTDGCPETENDIDGDGILNEVDQCPEVAEDRDSFQDDDGCPDPDNDADRVLDVNDRCPLDPEDLDSFQDDDGCPDPDNDGDGVVDLQDNCPMEPGVIENRGCPDRDRDGDTVVDRVDNCPDEPGTVENHGCREQQLVELRQGQLVILEKIYFRVNSATIDRRSFPLLDQVAAVLNAHPEILKVRVEGHTDSRGADARNLSLSQRRVNSVMTYLVRKGVARGRLEAVGYGETRPVIPNAATEDEHEANRRVEFVIVEYASAAQ